MAVTVAVSLKPPASVFHGGNRRETVARVSKGERFTESIVRFSASTVLFIGLSLRVCSPASARLLPPPIIATHSVTENEIAEEEKLEADFEAYKAKVYSLTVPLKLVALRGSVPPSWIKDFMSSQGKRVRLKTSFRANLEEIFFDLSSSTKKAKKGSALGADLISIGDSWLSFAIKEKLIEPMKEVEDQDWYKGLSDKWKIYLRRNNAGEKAPDGETWAVPYRWGSMVIAYKKSKFQQYKLAPIEIKLFDSTNYLKAFNVGDVWVTVGWSSDVIPVAKRMSNVTVIVPKSGATLWADLWAIPAVSVSGKEAEQLGGRVRGPSPVIHQWIEFCLQPTRSLPFTREVIPGASPSALEGPLVGEPEETKKDRTKLDTNLVSGVPPPDVLSNCEFLEPLPEATLLEYRCLVDSIKKQSQGPRLVEKLQDIVSIWVRGFRTKLPSLPN